MRGPAPPPVPQPGTRAPALPLVPEAPRLPTAEPPMASLAQQLRQITNRAHAQADEEAYRAGIAAGTAAGDAQPGAQAQGGGSIWNDGFQRAALQTGARRLEINARGELDRLARDNETDPEAFQRAAQSYREGITRGLPPELATRAAQSFDAMALPLFNQVQESARRAVAEQNQVSFDEALPARLAAMERNAINAPRDPAAAAALATDREALLRDLASLGPRGAFAMGGIQFEADNTRAGLPLTRLASQWQAIQRTVIGAEVHGQWLRAGQSPAWIDRWESVQLGTAPAGRAGGIATIDLPAAQVRDIARMLRSESARLQAQGAEARTRERGNLERLLTENAAALDAGLPAPHTLDHARLRAAGIDPDRVQLNQAARAERYQATVALNQAATPEALEALVAPFMPGTRGFSADPRAAMRVLELGRARGVQMAGAEIAQHVADLTAEARSTGVPASIDAERARAAGLSPEQRATVNREIAAVAEDSRLRAEAARLPPAERDARLRQLPISGDEAAENTRRLRVLAQAFDARDTAIRTDAAAWAVSASPHLAGLAQQVQRDPTWLPGFIAEMRDFQQQQGVPTEQRRAVPRPMAEALIANLGPPDQPAVRAQALIGLLAPLTTDARRDMLASLGDAGLPEPLRVAAARMNHLPPHRAIQLASELSIDERRVQLPEGERRNIREAVTSQMAEGIGALREAQYQATGDGAFLDIANRERQLLETLAVRRFNSGMAGWLTSGAGPVVRDAYADLFAGPVSVRREGVAVMAPAGTDTTRLATGLAALRDQAMSQIPGNDPAAIAAREVLRRGTWVNAGTGFAYHPQGSPLPMRINASGQLTVSLDEALNAGAQGTQDSGRAAPAQRRAAERWRDRGQAAP